MLGVKEYAAGKKKLDPSLGVKVSVKTGAGRPVARRLYEPLAGGLVVREAGQENRQRERVALLQPPINQVTHFTC